MQRGKARGIWMEHGRHTAFETERRLCWAEEEAKPGEVLWDCFLQPPACSCQPGTTWTTAKCKLATDALCSVHLMIALTSYYNFSAMGLAGRCRHLGPTAVLISTRGWTFFTVGQKCLRLYWGQDFIHRAWRFGTNQIQELTNTQQGCLPAHQTLLLLQDPLTISSGYLRV